MQTLHLMYRVTILDMHITPVQNISYCIAPLVQNIKVVHTVLLSKAVRYDACFSSYHVAVGIMFDVNHL